MRTVRKHSLLDQTVGILRGGIASGHWKGALPVVRGLAAELGVSSGTVQAALKRLAAEGWVSIRGSGAGMVREAVVPAGRSGKSASGRQAGMRVGVLSCDPQDQGTEFIQVLYLRLVRALEGSGHVIVHDHNGYEPRVVTAKQIAAYTRSRHADAWILIGANREVLQWAASRETPFYALGGAQIGIPIGGGGHCSKAALRDCVRHMAGLGHRRIVFVCRDMFRKPAPGVVAETFLTTLREQGIATSDYHLPDWEQTPAGFGELLHAQFRLTPPTAMILENPGLAVALLMFLGNAGLCVPRDVSVAVLSPDPQIDWARPVIAHFRKQPDRMMQRILQWLDGCAAGRNDRAQVHDESEFVPGGSIAPPRNG